MQASYYAQHLSVVISDNMLVKYLEKGAPDRGYPQAWAAMMEELDEGVGRLLNAIDEFGIGENIYVFFTADNGGRGAVPGGDFEDGRLPTNFPLSGAKHSLLEGGIRVPFLVRGPGIDAGSVCHEPVVGYDFLPTFQALAGGKKKALSDEVDGVSLVPLLSNPKGGLEREQGALFFHRPGKRESAVREGPWKLMVYWDEANRVESRTLYHVGKNPKEVEERNKAEGEADRGAGMEKRLLNFLAAVDAEKVGPKTVTIVDDVAPMFEVVYPNIVAGVTGGSPTSVSWSPPVASDNVIVTSLSSIHDSGTTFPLGETLVIYTAEDAAGNSAQTQFLVTVIDPYASWVAGFGLVGPAAALDVDFEGDLLTNLLEYAFGLNPAAPDHREVTPTEPGLLRLTIEEDSGQEFSTLEYARRTDPNGLVYIVVCSPDLYNWDDSEAKVESVGVPQPIGDGTMELVKVRYSVPILATPGRLFARVRVVALH